MSEHVEGGLASEAGERWLREIVFPGLTDLQQALPDQVPDGIYDAASYAVAHGLFCWTADSCRAAVALVDAGFPTQAAPLLRSAMEHVMVLGGAVDDGPAAVGALLRAHRYRMAQAKALVGDGWGSVLPEHFDAVLADEWPEGMPEGSEIRDDDRFLPFQHAATRYELSASLRLAWQTDSGLSHPSQVTASSYWRPTPRGDRLATAARATGRPTVASAGLLWWMAACEMERLTGWGNRLAVLGEPLGLTVEPLPRCA